MANFQTLFNLVSSMTRAEKKHFAGMTGYPRLIPIYYGLYMLVQDYPGDPSTVKDKFAMKYPRTSYASTAQHLYQVLLDSLTYFVRNNSRAAKVKFGLMNAQTLFERGLHEECLLLLDDLRLVCREHEMHDWLLMINQRELQYRHRLEYRDWSENEITRVYGEVNQDLRYLQTRTQHQMQFDLLNSRLRSPGRHDLGFSLSMLDDLAINELNIFSNPRYGSFEAEKLHLLFQSEYFMAKGDHQTSLRLFGELNALFQANSHLWQDPPLYYLSHLSGILRTLLYLGAYREMEGYLAEINRLKTIYPKSAFLLQCIEVSFRLLEAIQNAGSPEHIQTLVNEALYLLDRPADTQLGEAGTWLRVSLVSALLELKQYKQGVRYLIDLHYGAVNLSRPVHYAVRMLWLVLQFEMDNYLLVEKETRSFARYLKLSAVPDGGENRFFRMLNRYSVYDRFRFEEEARACLLLPIPDRSYHPQLQSRVYFDWRKWLSSKIIEHA